MLLALRSDILSRFEAFTRGSMMRAFVTLAATVLTLCACRDREPSTRDKELDVQIAQAHARQAQAEAAKTAIEAAEAHAAATPTRPSSGAQPFARTDQDAAQLAVKKYAYEAFGEWSQSHPDKACPDKLDDLNQYMDRKDVLDPWGHPYAMFCGAQLPAGAKGGLAVMSSGPDGHEGTEDDIKSW